MSKKETQVLRMPYDGPSMEEFTMKLRKTVLAASDFNNGEVSEWNELDNY